MAARPEERSLSEQLTIQAARPAARRPGGAPLVVAGTIALVASVAVVAATAERASLGATLAAAVADPLRLGLALTAYLGAFALRAALWTVVVPRLGLGHALAAIHVALAANHLLPLRLGEPLRVTSAVRRARIEPRQATASTVALRAADLASVVALAAVLAPALVPRLLGGWGWGVLVVVAAGGLAGWHWLRRLGGPAAPRRSRGTRAVAAGRVGLPGPLIVAGATAAWVLESAVVWQAAGWAGIHLDPVEALMVTVVSVAAQVVAVAPGGVGTYEAAAVAAYLLLGQRPGAALAAAVAAHAVKTAYALVAGAVAVFVPAPGELGRLRLAAVRGRPAARAAGHGPVVLFLPARDEEATVAQVLARAPAAVRGHPVVRLVVDDHSRDRTAGRAAGAGAAVVSTGTQHGLGAAVRRGLAEAVGRDAVAVAFCDADGEYDPSELERLVSPILDGQADYVVGSRFAGRIGRMLPHRRLGNRVLTRVLAFVARAEIGDGQSGFRALSGAAAADAEVVHDYNYAQVLTLDLLGKGYRYLEVPISYRFRESGRSFVRLGAYLRRVAPAVWRELNSPVQVRARP